MPEHNNHYRNSETEDKGTEMEERKKTNNIQISGGHDTEGPIHLEVEEFKGPK